MEQGDGGAVDGAGQVTPCVRCCAGALRVLQAFLPLFPTTGASRPVVHPWDLASL